jgi:hypothetical protein
MKTISILLAKYICPYKLEIIFNDNEIKIIDFSDFILKNRNVQIYKYKDLRRFRHFRIENGNVVWGKDWDLIFPIAQLYKGKIKFNKKK